MEKMLTMSETSEGCAVPNTSDRRVRAVTSEGTREAKQVPAEMLPVSAQMPGEFGDRLMPIPLHTCRSQTVLREALGDRNVAAGRSGGWKGAQPGVPSQVQRPAALLLGSWPFCEV